MNDEAGGDTGNPVSKGLPYAAGWLAAAGGNESASAPENRLAVFVEYRELEPSAASAGRAPAGMAAAGSAERASAIRAGGTMPAGEAGGAEKFE